MASLMETLHETLRRPQKSHRNSASITKVEIINKSNPWASSMELYTSLKGWRKKYGTYSYLFNSIFLNCIYCVSGSKLLGFLQFLILNIHSDNIRGTKSSCYLQTTGAGDLVIVMLKKPQWNWITNFHKYLMVMKANFYKV